MTELPLYERRELVNERRVRLYFRLADGSQRAVVVDQAADGPELRARLLQALAGELPFRRPGRRA